MSRRAFVTDDNAVNLAVASAMLKRLNWTVETFDNAGAMLARLEEIEPAVILLDISMPVLDGEEACALIRARSEWQGIRVIAYTAHAQPEERERFLAQGFDDVLIKPVSFADFRHSVGESSAGPG